MQKRLRHAKAPKQPKKAHQHHWKKITYQGAEFDSQNELLKVR